MGPGPPVETLAQANLYAGQAAGCVSATLEFSILARLRAAVRFNLAATASRRAPHTKDSLNFLAFRLRAGSGLRRGDFLLFTFPKINLPAAQKICAKLPARLACAAIAGFF